MIKPMAGAKFSMEWNGVHWELKIERFQLNGVHFDMLGGELGALVEEAFNINLGGANNNRFDRIVVAPQVDVPVRFDVNDWDGRIKKKEKKFKGNK